jgi:hypothetical protein
MHKGIGHGDARGESRRIRNTFQPLPISKRRSGEIRLAERRAILECIALNQPGQSGAVSARRRTENPRRGAAQMRTRQPARRLRQGIPIPRLIARGEALHRHVEYRHLRFEGIAEQTGNPQGHIHARPLQHRQRQNFDPANPVGAVIPNRLDAHQHESERQILAPGAQCGAAPKIEHQAARPIPLLLQMAAQNRLRGFAGEHHGGAGRHPARVQAKQVAPGRQCVHPPPARRARRTPARTNRPSSAASSAAASCGAERIQRRWQPHSGPLPGEAVRDVAASSAARRSGAGGVAEHMQPVADLTTPSRRRDTHPAAPARRPPAHPARDAALRQQAGRLRMRLRMRPSERFPSAAGPARRRRRIRRSAAPAPPPRRALPAGFQRRREMARASPPPAAA